MSTTAFTLDNRQFDAAMSGYAAASGKDFADISNAKVQEACFWASKRSKKAQSNSISGLFSQDTLLWWLAHRKMALQGGTRYENYKKATGEIRRRIKSVSFVKSFFIRMAGLFTPFTGRRAGRTGVAKGFIPYIKAAVKDSPTAEAGIRFTSNKWTGEDKQKVTTILFQAMQAGITASAANMQQYIDRKTGVTAHKYSAR